MISRRHLQVPNRSIFVCISHLSKYKEHLTTKEDFFVTRIGAKHANRCSGNKFGRIYKEIHKNMCNLEVKTPYKYVRGHYIWPLMFYKVEEFLKKLSDLRE